MDRRQQGATHSTPEVDTTGGLWPSASYTRQIAALKAAVGKKIYLVELKPSDINLGIRLSNTPHELLAVIDFPRPDPNQGLAPHLLLLDDGRGVNLGRIARISLNTPFSPSAPDILYQNASLMDTLLLRDRQLSKAFIGARSQALLGRLLGKPALQQVAQQEGAEEA